MSSGICICPATGKITQQILNRLFFLIFAFDSVICLTNNLLLRQRHTGLCQNIDHCKILVNYYLKHNLGGEAGYLNWG